MLAPRIDEGMIKSSDSSDGLTYLLLTSMLFLPYEWSLDPFLLILLLDCCRLPMAGGEAVWLVITWLRRFEWRSPLPCRFAAGRPYPLLFLTE